MKVIVKSVEDTAFVGNDGSTVPSAKVTFEQDGATKTLQTYIPPVVTQALSWQPGQEVDLEEYTDKKGKQRFKTPSSGGRQGGGGRGFVPDPLRYAVEAAVSIAQTAYRIPDAAASGRGATDAGLAADRMLAFVENAIPRILRAASGEAATDVVVSRSYGIEPVGATVQESGNPSEGTPAPAPSKLCDGMFHLGPLSPAPNPDAAKRGIVMCGACKTAGKWELVGAAA